MAETTNAVGAIVECKGKILILQRKQDNHRGGNWDIPGGRLKPNEFPNSAIKRELFEETGFVADENTLESVRAFNFDSNHASIVFNVFRLKIPKPFEVKLNPKEHTEHKWVTPKECYAMEDLIHGFHEILKEVYLSKQ